MRVTILVLGLELDLTFGLAADEAEDNGPGESTSYPISFVGTHEVPADMPWVERNNGWGDEEDA